MAKISRVIQKLFGSTGASGDFGQFGSLAGGAGVNTKDPATIQGLPAFLAGWASAVTAGATPTLEEMNSLFLLAFTQIAYILQAGIPEYEASTTYYVGSYCQVDGTIYKSLTDDNTGNTPASSPTNWVASFSDAVLLTGDQAVAGVKSFSSFPVTPSSAPTTNYQVANKKYVDDKSSLGSWVAQNVGTTYQASTDGFVVFFGDAAIVRGQQMAVYSDASGSPSTMRARYGSGSDQGSGTTLTVPIKKGDYYRCTWSASDAGTPTQYWIPLGS